MDSHLVTHRKLQELSTITLINCLQFILEIKKKEITNCYKDNPRNIYKELFKRLINPFYLPVLILISLMLILNSKENLKYNKNKYLIFFIGFIIIILSESSLGYISDSLIKNISISIVPIILTLLVYLVFIYKLSLLYRKI
jgi:lipopolysaccharide export system permease protein